ncbi:hypothetical protein [Methylobacterium sp. CM6257]
MKPIYPQREDHLSVPQPSAIAVCPVHEDEILQEQMRKLRNAQARQRAARRHLAGRLWI